MVLLLMEIWTGTKLKIRRQGRNDNAKAGEDGNQATAKNALLPPQAV